MDEEPLYRICFKRPDGSIGRISGEYFRRYAERQCQLANWAENGGRPSEVPSALLGKIKIATTFWYCEPITDDTKLEDK